MKIINSNENWISQTQNCPIKILLTSGKIWVNQSKKIHPTWKTNGIKSERSMILFINSQSLTSAQIQPRFPDNIPFIAVSYRHLISAISRSKKPTMGYFVVLLQPNVMLDKGWHLLKWPERKERNVFKYLHLFIKTIDRPGWGERALSVIIMRNVRCSDNMDIVITHCTGHLSLNTTDAPHIIVISY